MKALRASQNAHDVLPTFFTLASVASYFLTEERDSEAAEVLTVIVKHPFGDRETMDRMRPHLAQVRERLPPERMRAAEARAASALTTPLHAGSRNILPAEYFDQLVNQLKVPHQVSARFSSSVLEANEKLPTPLTERELEILQLMAAGLSNREIADHLVIALSTVKRHVSNFYEKLGVTSRTQAVKAARELYLL